jgi:hypothetical protein
MLANNNRDKQLCFIEKFENVILIEMSTQLDLSWT